MIQRRSIKNDLDNELNESIEWVLRVMNYSSNVYTFDQLLHMPVIQFYHVLDRAKDRARKIESANKK